MQGHAASSEPLPASDIHDSCPHVTVESVTGHSRKEKRLLLNLSPGRREHVTAEGVL